MKTVLIFAYECAPYHREGSTIGAQRPAMFAKYLQTLGWKVIVICCDARKRRTADSSDIQTLEKQLDETLLSDPSFPLIIPTPSLKHDGIIDKLWFSQVLTDQASGTFISGSRLNPFRKILTLIKLFLGDYSQSWQPVALKVAEKIMSRHKVDICIGEHSPDAGIFLASTFSKKYKLPWVADFRDPILQPHNPINQIIYKKIVKSLLHSCAATINVTPYWQKLDAQLFGLPSYCITNGFDEEEFQASPPHRNKFTLFYSGSVKSSVQNILIFFEGIKMFLGKLNEKDREHVSFYYRGLSLALIKKLSEDYQVKDVVNAEAHIPRAQLIHTMQQSHLLLLLSADTSKAGFYYAEGFYPGKVFEYFGAGKPILCVPGDNGILNDLIVKSNTGIIKSTSEDISAYLLSSFLNWQNGKDIHYQPNQKFIRQYTRKQQARELCSILDKYI